LLHDTSGQAVAMGMPTAGPSAARWATNHVGRATPHGRPDSVGSLESYQPPALIIAESGSGKTYVTSGLLAQELALGEDAVLLLDRA
jgi:hypothetical protein